MLILTYACGFRVSELISLKIGDLNFEEMIGHIRQAKGKKDRVCKNFCVNGFIRVSFIRAGKTFAMIRAWTLIKTKQTINQQEWQ